eukprot:299373-Chlamydomonas_euryale.AAC.3
MQERGNMGHATPTALLRPNLGGAGRQVQGSEVGFRPLIFPHIIDPRLCDLQVRVVVGTTPRGARTLPIPYPPILKSQSAG